MDALFVGVFLPHIVVRLHINALQPIPCNNIEFPDRVVIFRRITCSDHNPAVGYTVPSEYLVLQKLQHGRGQGFRHTVDLVQEQNTLSETGALHHVIDRSNNLGHGVLGHTIFHTAVDLLLDKWQTKRALPGVVGHGITDETHTQFFCHLFHDGSLANAGRAHQKNGPLPLDRN